MKKYGIIFFLFLVESISAAQTKYVNLQGSDALSKGDFHNIQLDTQGRLSLSSSLKEVYDTKNLLIQSSVETPQGVYFSTAKDAGLFLYDPKKKSTKKLYENPQSLSIPSFAINGHTLYFVESPSNTLYSLDLDKPDNDPQKIRDIKIADYVWQVGVSGKSLYFTTGGKSGFYELPLDRLQETPKKIFESPDERHFLTMKLTDKTAYLGGEGLGGVYKVDLGTGKTNVLYNTYEGTVSDISPGPDGSIFVTTSNKEPKPPGKDFDYTDTLLASQKKYQLMQAKVADSKHTENSVNPGSEQNGLSVKNSLYQIQENGTVDKLFTLDNTGLNTIYYDEKEKRVLAGSSGGRIFQFDMKTRDLSLLGTLDDEDVTSLVGLKDSFLVMTSNIGQLYLLGKHFSKFGTYISDIIDLGNTGVLGQTKLEESNLNHGNIQVFVRGGQTPKIDRNWTDWEGPLSPKDEKTSLGKVHYIQYKTEIKGDGQTKSPILERILTAYLPDNKIPSISLFSVSYDEQSPSAQKQNLQLRWNAVDADKDQLIYRVYFKERGDVSWSLLLESPTQDKTVLDTRVLPDGVYQFKLEVSDELDNGKERAGKAMQLSSYILVNNTPPELKISSVNIQGATVKIHGTASSKAALIGKIYYKLGVESDWNFVQPDSGLYDSKTVSFSIQIPLKDLKGIENFVFIRTFDVNMNQVSSRVKLNRLGKQI